MEVKHAATTRSPSSPRVAVLAFHKIGPPPPGQPSSWFYISQAVFENLLAWLQTNSWRVISQEEFLHGLDVPGRLPDCSALITFDDGYRSLRDVALPVLRSYGLPSVVFLPVDYVGSTNRFDVGVEPEELVCGWHDLEELQRGGMSIQAHSVSHPHLSTVDDAQLQYENRAFQADHRKQASDRRSSVLVSLRR
jgi:peptidoglycan/xylan/chitin deacetylase (PgdA/CDA1 family)